MGMEKKHGKGSRCRELRGFMGESILCRYNIEIKKLEGLSTDTTWIYWPSI
jgi:hypothetical protein